VRAHANHLALIVLSTLIGSAEVCAQCATQWLPGEALVGANHNVHALTMWDRDGAGPIPPVLVVGGEVTVNGTIATSGIACYDRSQACGRRLAAAWTVLFRHWLQCRTAISWSVAPSTVRAH